MIGPIPVPKKPSLPPSMPKKEPSPVPADKSIFAGRQEISRKELRQKLAKDPSVYQAARGSMLSGGAIERMKLEKELFPQVYGSNLSKSDMRTRLHKLSQKMLGEANPQVKATLRKQINFFKKIGGL